MMPLGLTKTGEKVIVARIGGAQEVKKHLEDLGFVVGQEVYIISTPGAGNIIVNVKNTRLAITEQMAAKIMVQ